MDRQTENQIPLNALGFSFVLCAHHKGLGFSVYPCILCTLSICSSRFILYVTAILVPGPPLDKLNGDISTSSVQSAVNVISLKVTESDVGKELNVFGTVIARDQVDYRCLFLFKRGEADAQTISLPVCYHSSLISLLLLTG